MQQALQRSNLVPSGFVVESAYFEGDKAVIAVRASGSVVCVHRAERFLDVSIAGIGDA
ncbi:hypothetical protein ACVIHI_008418 [Bradyrhizobium sp. USDA 4524]|nr:hypothetical protein [Bradyrhizobium sp. USDA 4538]MCP1899136.1 hypothetical protein [Bradyrhizobium sp. USDA 4537]MCP1986667.1 hypothetical protein [Bradyrhizobium sp. USDA 4539]MCP1838655.1 hypothetical protein [Bradyrhizobium sp. USDA 4538]MCP1899221.1 hypothetical protein [Bradyrhizobium sp. USDA 4537]